MQCLRHVVAGGFSAFPPVADVHVGTVLRPCCVAAAGWCAAGAVGLRCRPDQHRLCELTQLLDPLVPAPNQLVHLGQCGLPSWRCDARQLSGCLQTHTSRPSAPSHFASIHAAVHTVTMLQRRDATFTVGAPTLQASEPPLALKHLSGLTQFATERDADLLHTHVPRSLLVFSGPESPVGGELARNAPEALAMPPQRRHK